MTTRSIMSSRLIKLRADAKVAGALLLMHRHQVRNLPVIGDKDEFIGLFGIRRLSRLLLPSAAYLERHSLPVIVVEGKENRLVGMVSAWDVLEKLVINVFSGFADEGAGTREAGGPAPTGSNIDNHKADAV